VLNATPRNTTPPSSETIERYGRVGRWLHAGTYLTTLTLLATGWWFVVRGYTHRSPLAHLTGQPDTTIHELTGYAAILVVLVWLVSGARGLREFVRETLRYRPGDGRWLVGFPRAAVTGRFAHHDGHFDPGQRVANIAMVTTIAVLVGTGLGLLYLPRGGFTDGLLDVHRWSMYALTPVVAGHVVVAAGVLPGYRGVWRSMHLGGRLPVDVARRIWPGWLDRARGHATTRPSKAGRPEI
jgi:formate dehydrogenase subunit gamma